MDMTIAEQWITSKSAPKSPIIHPEQSFGLEVVTDEHAPEKIAFMAYVKDFTWNARDGELNIKLAAPMAEKHKAMKITDHPGMMLDITASVVVFDEDGDED